MADNVIWRPQPGPQHSLITCTLPEVFFGGARYGGKTDGVLGKWALKEQIYGENFNAIMFRPTTTASDDAIERSKQIYEPLGGKFNESKLTWRMPHGGRMRFSYLKTIQDADNFQGKNLTDAWTDEGGQYPSPAPIDRLFGALRSAQGVPVQLVITANPGGPGQTWIAQRYKLIPLPQRPQVVVRHLPNGATHKMAVIPSRITDNKIGLRGDPGYVNRLHLTGSAALVKAWLDGDWNAVDGAYFDCWNPAKMVIKPFPIPSHWTRFRSYDWGTASPFSVGWWAVSDGSVDGIPPGALVRYREWYGAHPDKPNVGLKMTNRGMAKGILEREASGEKIDYSVADPSIFMDKGGPTIAEEFASEGVFFIPGDNARLNGWSQMRQRMTGNAPEGDANGHVTEIVTQGCQNTSPMVFCFSTCVDSIRTIPALPHSLRNPEDLDTDAEDHIADEWRYGLMSRPWVTAEQKKPDYVDRWDKAFSKKGKSKSWR